MDAQRIAWNSARNARAQGRAQAAMDEAARDRLAASAPDDLTATETATLRLLYGFSEANPLDSDDAGDIAAFRALEARGLAGVKVSPSDSATLLAWPTA